MSTRLVSSVLVIMALLFTPIRTGAQTMPSDAAFEAWFAATHELPACGIAARDDYSQNPKIVNANTQRARIHAYVLCRKALYRSGASSDVLHANSYFLGRACVIYALENSRTGGILDDCK